MIVLGSLPLSDLINVCFGSTILSTIAPIDRVAAGAHIFFCTSEWSFHPKLQGAGSSRGFSTSKFLVAGENIRLRLAGVKPNSDAIRSMISICLLAFDR